MLRKYGTSDDQRVTGVEDDQPDVEWGDPEAIIASASRNWTPEDEKHLQGETEH